MKEMEQIKKKCDISTPKNHNNVPIVGHSTVSESTLTLSGFLVFYYLTVGIPVIALLTLSKGLI